MVKMDTAKKDLEGHRVKDVMHQNKPTAKGETVSYQALELAENRNLPEPRNGCTVLIVVMHKPESLRVSNRYKASTSCVSHNID
jgi:hypothetical protein